MEENKVTFGTGIKVWSILCIVSGTLTAIFNLVSGNYLLVITGIFLLASYAWLLIGKKRLAFFLVIAAAAVGFILNIAIYNINFIIALLGFANPLIAYALLSKYWHQME